MKRAGLITASLITALASTTHAAIPTMPDPKTAAAVEAADQAWSGAEQKGDAEFVAWLLLPEYRSVGPAGTFATRGAIVAHAKAQTPENEAKSASMVAKWKSDHPSRADVRLFGDTAVLTWTSTRPEAKSGVYSCDIFTYRDGHWHAVYSQHTSAS